MKRCQPTAALIDPRVDSDCPCIVCGEMLYRHWSTAGDDFRWIDAKERAVGGDPPEGFADGYTWLAWLSEQTDTVRFGTYVGVTVIKSEGGLFPWEHLHDPGSESEFRGELPWCCEQPMQAARDGWLCRGAKQLFPYEIWLATARQAALFDLATVGPAEGGGSGG